MRVKVGVAAVQQEEKSLLKAAEVMDPGRFAGVAKAFEYRLDHAAALAEANRAHERRYLHLSEPRDGLMHLEGCSMPRGRGSEDRARRLDATAGQG